MQLVSKAKIGRLSAKGIDYSPLRLPREYSRIVGTTADIVATEHEGKQEYKKFCLVFSTGPLISSLSGCSKCVV
ncbi:MAG: hypothetical protein ACXW1R_07300 [Halobacteriota archaeon]